MHQFLYLYVLCISWSLALLTTYVTDLEDIRDVPDGIIKFKARRSVCFVIKNDE